MKLKKAQRILLSSSLSVFLAGCGAPNFSPSESHITVEEVDSQKPVAKPESIPPLVKASPTAPVMSGEKGSSTYDVVVTGQPVRDLLFALARDSGVNMDVDDDVSGLVTMSALDQTLDAILARIARQIDIRVETVGDAILIKADSPYHKHYHVDFLNVARTYSSSTSSSGVGEGEGEVESSAENNFWEGLEESIETILEVEYEGGESAVVASLGDGDAADRAGAVAEEEARIRGESSFNLNAETGVLVVYAPDRLQKEVQALLDGMLSIAKRQVLLEATVVEVVLNNQYTQGIDWSLFNSLATDGLALYQGANAGGAASALRYVTRELTRNLPETIFSSEDFLTSALISAADPNRAEVNAERPDDYDDLKAAEESAKSAFDRASAARVAAGNNPAAELVTAEEQAQSALDAARARVTVANDAAESAAKIAVASRQSRRLAREAAQERVENFRSNIAGEYDVIEEYEFEIEEDLDDDTGIATYTASAEVVGEFFNEKATIDRAGGLSPINQQDSLFTAAYRKGDLSAAVQLLDEFGDAKVLSSPRISALNYQPALLRVVDQEVYFTSAVTSEYNETTGQLESREVEFEENTVDIGFAMNVLPHITEDGEIILNLKPSVTRVLGYRDAPTPSISGANTERLENKVPITRVRELESVISLRDGEVAVLGGLLEDRTGDTNSSVPGLSRLPGVGALFEKKNESTFKTEFVVFIRARVIKNPSINGDYSDYRHLLPDTDFIVRDREGTLLPPAQQSSR